MHSDDQILRELTRLLDVRSPDADPFFGEVPESRIAEAEHALGTRFPRSYRLFLRRFGAAQFGDYHIYGLSEPNPDSYILFLDVVSSTLHWMEPRPDWDALPSDSIDFATFSGELSFCFDAPRTADGEFPVIARAGGYPPHLVAPNFLEWLRMIVEVPDPFWGQIEGRW